MKFFSTLIVPAVALQTSTEKVKPVALVQTSSKSVYGGAFGGSDNHEFLHPVSFSQKLRVCNAYADSGAVDVYKNQEKVTREGMKFKDCQDLETNLRAGDKLKFKVRIAKTWRPT